MSHEVAKASLFVQVRSGQKEMAYDQASSPRENIGKIAPPSEDWVTNEKILCDLIAIALFNST